MRCTWFLFSVLLIYGCSGKPDIKSGTQPVPTSDDFQKAEAFFNTNNQRDSAFYFFTNVAETSKDSLLVAMAYTYMAIIQEDAGDHYGSQESALEGLKHVQENNPQHYYCLSSIYNEMGVSNKELKNYDAAIEYYELAIQFQQDENYKNVFRNNKALVYKEKKEYGKAIAILDSIVEKQRDNPLDYARTSSNLASIQWLNDPTYNPVPAFQAALDIRRREKHDIGITASYNHLSEYYFRRNPDSAFYYTNEMYRLAQKAGLMDERLLALGRLISLSPAAQSRSYFAQYQHLSDSVSTARNKAKNQFALIRYRSEKNKTENLFLQQDNYIKELQILRQRIWLYGIITGAIVVLLSLLWWQRKKRQAMEWKSQAIIRENHLRTSQKVHDIVANGLYRMMNELEHSEQMNKEALLDRIEYLYERSRDISYEPVVYQRTARERIHAILQSFATPERHVHITEDSPDIWNSVGTEVSTELERVLEELMVNMDKHSGAKNVDIRFTSHTDALTVSYRDDGVGFAPAFRPGNGLKSTENRIQRIGGKLIFTAEKDAGASIQLIIPKNRK